MPPSIRQSMSFHPAPPNWGSRWIIKLILAAVGIFIVAFLALSSPPTLIQLKYDWSAHPSTGQTAVAATPATIPAISQITIPKINVVAPIIFEPSLENTAVLNALQHGVIHYATTAAPGQPGNVVIFGHSSEDWWEPGNYKFIFTLLNKLTTGDRVVIDYGSRQYTYQVTGSKIVAPTDVSVLDPTSVPTLSLITCSPVGTSLRRLVVTATQVSPSPTINLAASAPPQSPMSATPGQTLVGSSGVSIDAWNLLTRGWDAIAR